MATPRLISVRWLRNHGVTISYAKSKGAGTRQALKRFEPPATGQLTVGEAAKLIRSSEMRVYRMIERGELESTLVAGRRLVSVKTMADYWRRQPAPGARGRSR